MRLRRWWKSKQRIDYDAIFAADDRLKYAIDQMKASEGAERIAWHGYFKDVMEASGSTCMNERAYAILALPYPGEL